MWSKSIDNGGFHVEQSNEIKSPVDQLRELKKAKWEAFCKKHGARIAFMPMKDGKKVIPAMWVDKIQDWVWVSRSQRRHLERKAR